MSQCDHCCDEASNHSCNDCMKDHEKDVNKLRKIIRILVGMIKRELECDQSTCDCDLEEKPCGLCTDLARAQEGKG